MSRVTATATLEVVSAKMDALTAAIQALVAAQSHAVVTPIAAPQAAPVPTQAPANEVPVAEPYVPAAAPAVPATTMVAPAIHASAQDVYADIATVKVAPKTDGKSVIPSVAAWQHDGVLWVAFPPMGNCADEANVLFDALRSESWFVNFDKAGNASPKKSVRVLPYIADKGLAAKYSGHSASIGSFDRAPKLAEVAKRVKEIFAARKIVPVEVAKPATKAAPAKSDMPVFA